MSMDCIYDNEILEEWLQLQQQFIRLYKIAWSYGRHYSPIYGFNMRYYEEYANAETDSKIETWLYEGGTVTGRKVQYNSGFHFFTTREDAYDYCHSPHGRNGVADIISCIVNKDNITSIGMTWHHKNRLTVVSSKALFPVFPETDVSMSKSIRKETVYDNSRPVLQHRLHRPVKHIDILPMSS